jgi:hypothetical protein
MHISGPTKCLKSFISIVQVFFCVVWVARDTQRQRLQSVWAELRLQRNRELEAATPKSQCVRN